MKPGLFLPIVPWKRAGTCLGGAWAGRKGRLLCSWLSYLEWEMGYPHHSPHSSVLNGSIFMLLQKHLPCRSPFWWEGRPPFHGCGALTGYGRDKEEVTSSWMELCAVKRCCWAERGADLHSVSGSCSSRWCCCPARMVLVCLAVQRQMKSKLAS